MRQRNWLKQNKTTKTAAEEKSGSKKTSNTSTPTKQIKKIRD